ncbi:MAG TPA: DNA polymerase [Candidatus Paceibacterota bacterium]
MTTKVPQIKEKIDKKRLVLLDSHAIIHRAYHALPDFSSTKGEPTGALYGLITMLLKIIADLKPDYIVACFDLPGPTHRHEEYKEYKATRAKAEDALVAQLIRSRSVFKAFGIPQYELAGFEADDLLGTIANQLSDQPKIEIIIASGDLDTLQLVEGSRVKVYTLRKGISDTVIYDEAAVQARFGFSPKLIADYKGLRGDPSDNIKGVTGIGEKTASELIAKFGPVEHIFKVLEKDPGELEKQGIKARIVKLLAESKKIAEQSKRLASIRLDAPIKFSLPAEGWRMEDHRDDMLALCEELEFRTLRERIRALVPMGTSDEEKRKEEAPFEVEPLELEETAIALWLLQSDTTNPSLGDILAFARPHVKENTFEAARRYIFSELEKTGQLKKVYENIERPLLPIIHRMNDTGIRLDTDYLKNLAAEYQDELSKISSRIYKVAGHVFNISSPKQLSTVLFDELKLSLPRHKKTPGGARTTREDELSKMKGLHPIIDDILGFRELYKLLTTYIEKMPQMVAPDGRLHAQFLQTGTTTGRMSSQNPNLQNIPTKTDYGRRVRSAFSADKGNLIVALDYSQIELRIAAGLSGDKKLTRIFEENRDVHTEVAAQVFNVAPEDVNYEMRRRAKVINFGILYGMGVNALRANLGESVSRDESAKFLSEYFKKFSGLALWIERVKLDAARTGYTETLFGRRRYFSGFKSLLPNLRSQAERMAVNAPLQGTQADIIKIAMIRADELIEKNNWREKVRLILQVHDELVYEIERGLSGEAGQAIRKIMESVVSKKQLSGVPIVAQISVGENWGNMNKVS